MKTAQTELSCFRGDPGGSRTPNTHLRTVVFYPLNYRATLLAGYSTH